MTLNKTIIHTSQVALPGPVSSQAVGYGGLFFLSGQIALDPYHHDEIFADGVREQTRRVLENVRLLLLAAGLDLAHVLRVTLYLKNMSDLARVDEVYGEFFEIHPPARSVIEVSRLPLDALLCVDVTAAAPPPEPPLLIVERSEEEEQAGLEEAGVEEQAEGEQAGLAEEQEEKAPAAPRDEALVVEQV